MSLYGSVDYWNKRYQATARDPPVEWYRNYSGLKHLLNPISFCTSSGTSNNVNSTDVAGTGINHNGIKKSNFNTDTVTPVHTSWTFPSRDNCRVLILGCGNSVFGEDMIRDGWTGSIVQVDYSQVVIDQMKARYNDEFYEAKANNSNSKKDDNKKAMVQQQNHDVNKKKMEFICADITDEDVMMSLFKDSSFDLILCKGTFDAVLNSATATMNIKKVVRQCHRILAEQHGILFIVTNGNADNRVEYLEHENDLSYYWQGVGIHSINLNNNNNYNKQSRQHQQRSSSNNKDIITGAVEKNFYVYICRKRSIPTVLKPQSSAMTAISNIMTGKENIWN